MSHRSSEYALAKEAFDAKAARQAAVLNRIAPQQLISALAASAEALDAESEALNDRCLSSEFWPSALPVVVAFPCICLLLTSIAGQCAVKSRHECRLPPATLRSGQHLNLKSKNPQSLKPRCCATCRFAAGDLAVEAFQQQHLKLRQAYHARDIKRQAAEQTLV